jgi:hypothetical protein
VTTVAGTGSGASQIFNVEIGSTNMILQDNQGRCTLVDISVGMDPEPVRS